MELGADDYITKPFAPVELVKSVRTQLDKQATIAHKFESTLSALRTNIAYALPHELKTPLIGIEGYGRLLMMDYDKLKPEQLLEYATWIVKSSERLQRVIENCLVYAQIELIAADPAQLVALRNHNLANPAAIIAEAAHQSAELAARAADLKLDLSGTEPLQISEENLKKIVRELVNNAFKFSEKGKPVTVSGTTADGKFVVRVRDLGRGMSAEHIQSIGAYMQFERALYEQQGLGLGFVIARRLVELHGGTIHVWSIPSQGTEVSVRLPMVASGSNAQVSA
jgi:two-component system sensor histidine kinase/response regulator